MKLPEQIPRELVGLLVDKMFDGACEDISPLVEIYDVIVDYFNYQPTVWHPVSEKPEEGQIVWGTDGINVGTAVFINDTFASNDVPESVITKWTPVENTRPQPPKESI